ncbi:hypothetical protein BH24ACT5_BH24ACT5_22420 [soil metagenome]
MEVTHADPEGRSARGAEIRAAIEAAGGAIPFQEFQRLALYGTDGFYAHAGGRAGRRGDFLTSPEVGPLFGVVIARYLDAVWVAFGRPDVFTVVDAGAGPGTLARAVTAAAAQCGPALRYVAVEMSVAQRSQHPDGVESRSELPEGPFDGVIIANELLDNVPFRLCVFDGGWREAFVTTDPGGGFSEVLSTPFDPVPGVLPAMAPHGARAPLVSEAGAWVDRARSRLRSGSLLVIDYGRPTTAEFAAVPWREWLRTYRGHERGGHYLDAPGAQDITVDLPLDQLSEPDTIWTQAQFLELHGIDELVAQGRAGGTAGAAFGGLEALRMRSRVREAEALLDPAGLGGFTVLEWHASR